jgi:secreted Zn-dependent insulinase-like peptidase
VFQSGVQEWVFEELKAQSEVRFHFCDKQEPYNYVRMLSSNLQLYPWREVLLACYAVPQVRIYSVGDQSHARQGEYTLWVTNHMPGRENIRCG